MFPHSEHSIPVHISQQATEWFVKLQAEDSSDQDLIEFKQWLALDPLHQMAWQRLEEFAVQLQHAQHPLLQSALHAVKQEQHVFPQHLNLFLLFLVLGVSISGFYFAYQQQFFQLWQADYRTATGEQKHVELVDGSKIILNTDTAINVKYEKNQRLIELIKGEIHIQVFDEKINRPFYIKNRDGIMQDIGTTFNVRQYTDHSVLRVNEGEVKVRTQHSGQVVHVMAQQQIWFNRNSIDQIERMEHQYDAWTQGMLNVYKMPLPQFLQELDRYHSGKIIFDAQELKNIEVSGVFPIVDSETTLQALQRGLPIQVEHKFYFWDKVSLKKQDTKK